VIGLIDLGLLAFFVILTWREIGEKQDEGK
jgi:hypothetical protein